MPQDWKEVIDSVAKLELLLFLSENPSTMDTVESLAIWTGLGLEEARLALEELADGALVGRTGEIFFLLEETEPQPLITKALADYRSQRALLRKELARVRDNATELRRRLRTAEVRSVAVLESIREAIILLRPSGEINPMNKVARDLDCISKARTFQDLDPSLTGAIERATMNPKHPPQVILGSRTFVVRAAPLAAADETGSPPEIVVTLYDVTERVETERLRNDLTRMITHDLLSPMSGIAKAFEFLVQPEHGGMGPRQRRLVEVGQRSSRYILGLVSNLLDVTRLEDGALHLNRTLCCLEEFVEAAFATLESLAGERRLTLEQRQPAEGPTKLTCDGDLMLRVTMNLLSNAIKFSKRGGLVEVETGRDARFAWLFVRDEGSGIPEPELGRVFEKYFRVSTSRGSLPAGSGLGLYFVRLVVEAHGGGVSAQNREPSGCELRVWLPL